LTEDSLSGPLEKKANNKLRGWMRKQAVCHSHQFSYFNTTGF
jgi:hypothetical protein